MTYFISCLLEEQVHCRLASQCKLEAAEALTSTRGSMFHRLSPSTGCTAVVAQLVVTGIQRVGVGLGTQVDLAART